MAHRRNAGRTERWLSALTGAALAGYGLATLRRRAPAGLALAVAGTGLVYRGASGRRIGRRARPLEGIRVYETVTINRPPADVYRFWRKLENLPSFMKHLEDVRSLPGGRSRWTARGPAGLRVAWDAEIVNEVEPKLIGWRSLNGAQVDSVGSVSFEEAPGDRGTEVRVRLEYEPPAGRLGAGVAMLFGEEPSQQIREDLRRLKQLLEAGEIATTEGQPRGT